jgi:hypothetical protein
MTTQSTPPAATATPVAAGPPPDCATLKAEIDRLDAAKIPQKIQQAAARSYTPTNEEYALFPRYSALTDTYTVQQCNPPLRQLEAAKPPVSKPKAKVAAAAATPKAAGKPAASPSAKAVKTAKPAKQTREQETPAAPPGMAPAQTAPGEIVWPKAGTTPAPTEGVMMRLPPPPPKQ